MTQINEEDRKKIDNYASKYKDYPNPKNALMRGVLLGAEFSYHLRDSEVERLRKELNNALSVKVNEQAIKQIVNRPGIVSKICANEIRKNETLESELAALKKQVEELRALLQRCKFFIEDQAWTPNLDKLHNDIATYITDKQI